MARQSHGLWQFACMRTKSCRKIMINIFRYHQNRKGHPATRRRSYKPLSLRKMEYSALWLSAPFQCVPELWIMRRGLAAIYLNPPIQHRAKVVNCTRTPSKVMVFMEYMCGV